VNHVVGEQVTAPLQDDEHREAIHPPIIGSPYYGRVTRAPALVPHAADGAALLVSPRGKQRRVLIFDAMEIAIQRRSPPASQPYQPPQLAPLTERLHGKDVPSDGTVSSDTSCVALPLASLLSRCASLAGLKPPRASLPSAGHQVKNGLSARG
jgi:hypothetical protein